MPLDAPVEPLRETKRMPFPRALVARDDMPAIVRCAGTLRESTAP